MADEVVVQPGDVVVVADPPPAAELAAVETATAAAVTEGVRIATEEGGEWQQRSFEVMESLLNETREQRAEMVSQMQELILRVKDQAEQQTVMNSRLAELSRLESPTLILATDPTTPPPAEPVVSVTDTSVRKEGEGSTTALKSEKPEEKPKPKRKLI